MTQGRCEACKVAFRFNYPKRLRDAYCPYDGTKLIPTTHLYRRGRWETRNAISYREALRKFKGRDFY